MARRCLPAVVAATLIVAAGSGLPPGADAQTLPAAGLPAPSASVPLSTLSSTSSEQAPTSRDGSGPGFESIFTDTISDFGRLPSKETFAILGVGFLAAMSARPSDQPVSNTLSGSLRLDNVFEAGETVGGAPLQLAGAFAAYTVGRVAGHQKLARVGADLVSAQIMSQVVTSGVKMAVGRTRPDGTRYSFPSGHSSTTFASATVLQRHFGWKVGIPAYGVAAYVAASRIQEKRHYLSDVVFGAALGIAVGRTVTVGRGNARFAVAPMPAPGGGGVSFTWLGAQ